jgi:hypothetical protein
VFWVKSLKTLWKNLLTQLSGYICTYGCKKRNLVETTYSILIYSLYHNCVFSLKMAYKTETCDKLLINLFLESLFFNSVIGRSLCTYKRCWKWFPRATAKCTATFQKHCSFIKSKRSLPLPVMSLLTYRSLWTGHNATNRRSHAGRHVKRMCLPTGYWMWRPGTCLDRVNVLLGIAILFKSFSLNSINYFYTIISWSVSQNNISMNVNMWIH